MTSKLSSTIAIILTLAACSGRQIQPATSSPLRLEQAEKAILGVYRQEDIKKTFGNPSRTAAAGTIGELEYWFYMEAPLNSTPRLSMGFDPKTGILRSKSWDVREGDPEQDLSSALAHFKEANLHPEQPTWNNPHMAPTQVLYSDQNLGLTIVFQSTSQRVSGIEWSSKNTTQDSQ